MEMYEDEWDLVENAPGLFIHEAREAKGYIMEEISHGICSLATLKRIEKGERVTDYLTMEALLERMKIEKSEYEFVLDEDDYSQYMKREEIRKAVRQKEYKKAEQKLAQYEKKYGEAPLHKQFIYYQRALLEQRKGQMENEKVKEIFEKAILITVPDYKEILEKKEILGNTELYCLIGIINCMEDSLEREEKYEELYKYFNWCESREKMFPTPYRTAMLHYADCLHENKKYEACIKVCNEVLEVLYTTSKLEDRNRVFELRAKAREQIGFANEEEKQQCIKDFLTAYYVTEFYDGEEAAKQLKEYMKEVYKWQFIE